MLEKNGGSGGSSINAIQVDASTPPGTNPVVPNAANLLTMTGAQVAAGTTSNVIRTDSVAANTVTIEVQRSQAVASSTIGDNGVSHFDSHFFTVDANGFVSFTGTGAAETLTGNSGGAVGPTANNINTVGTGSITIVGNPGTSTLTTELTGLTNHSLLVGAGTPTITSLGVSTDGQLPIGSTGADPVLATLTAGTGISITNGAGSITIAANGSAVVETLTGNTGGAISPTAGNINTVGTGSITIAGSGSTLTTQLTGLTAHDVLIGAGTATIGLVAPSATSGVPLISQGAAADPVFGTAVVAGGGTGATTLTNHGVLLGQGSSAVVATAVGATGTVLAGNTGADPTFQTIAAAGGITTITGNTGGAESPLAGNFNIVGTGSITVAGSANTETVQLTGLTNHSLLVGAGTATITNLGVATNGQLPIGSTGADPVLATLTAGTGISISNGAGSITIAATALTTWTDNGTNFNAAVNNGYFTTAALTATLPASPSQGDTIVFIADTASQLTISANTGQIIRIGSATSTAAGTAKSNAIGDSVTLTYRAADTTWLARSVNGTWTTA